MMLDATPIPDRRRGDSVVLVISQKLENLQGEMGEMRAVLRELTTAVTKLAIIEERQTQISIELNRAFREIDKCTTRHDVYHSAEIADFKLVQLRISALEMQTPISKQTSTWVTNTVVGAVMLVIMFVATKVGLK